MSPPDDITVGGFLADGDTGTGLGGLRVELWSTNGGEPSLAAVSQSDDAGLFGLRLAPDSVTDTRHGGPVAVELRVLDGGKQLLSEVRALAVDGTPERIELSVPQSLSEGADEREMSDHCEVMGQVKGSVLEGATVRAFLRTLRQGVLAEQVVAETMVSSDGFYQMDYERPARLAESSDTSLIVRLYAPNGELIAESTPVLSPRRRMRVNLRPRSAAPTPSEYELLERHITAQLETGPAGLDGADESVIEEVSEWLDVDSQRLMVFQQARALESDTGLPASMFYALGRGGAGLTLEELIDVPLDALRTAVEEAAADGIVDAELLENLDSHVEHLARHVVDHATRPGRPSVQFGLPEILEAADIPPQTIKRVLHTYQARSGEVSNFWESFGESIAAEGVDDGVAQEIEVALKLGEVLGPDPALLRRMHQMRREGRWQAPKELARFSFDDWCDLIEELESSERPAESVEDEDATTETEEEVQERIEARAEAILDMVEETFPNEFIHQRLAEAEEISPGARQLLGRAADHNFRGGSIRDRVNSDPNLVEGLTAEEAAAAVEEVEAVERVSRVADRADDVALLVGTGMGSAMDIASTPRGHFIEVYGEALGGRAQASRIHAQAQQTAAGTKLAALRLVQALQHMPHVLGAPRPEIKELPDARTLFRDAGAFCDCEHCGSVYSPAAYFVDLLRYLDVSKIKSPERLERLKDSENYARILKMLRRRQPLDVLLGRRPDLADLQLTCENTLTALPYIDLVNELLEARITGTSAAHDTGKTPADVLRAVPQNILRDAYLQLEQAVHPLSLPYHQPLSLSRAYLAHLGVTRLELMKALGKGESLRAALVAEALGMSPEEFVGVARPPADLWRHFGFAAASDGGMSYVDALMHVPRFLDATGITFQSLIDLVSTRFVNADSKLKLDTPIPDCDPQKIRIAGLDAARLSRMVRLIRLQRRLGWPFAILDRALVAFGATDLDVDVLEKLAAARDLASHLDRPLVELLVLWAPLDSWGKDSQFDRLFTTRAVMWQTQDEKAFQLRPDRLELAETSDSMDAVTSALFAGFRITSEELALIRELLKRRGAVPRLDIAGLSAIYRVVVLARALQLRIASLDLMLRLIPPEADPFRAGDPAATRRFADIVREVQASDFTAERLAYLFRHESDPRRDPAPLPAQVEAVLGSIRRGLADAFGETSRPAEVSAETLRQKLALLLDPALLDPALETLDPRTSGTPTARREFFDRHLAPIFPDPAAAAASLFGGPLIGPAPASSPTAALPPSRPMETPPDTPAVTSPATPSTAAVPGTTPSTPPAAPADGLEARWRANTHFVLEHLLPQLRTRQLRGAVVQTLSDTLGLSSPSTARLLDIVLRSRDRKGEPLLRDFLALLGTGLTGAYYADPALSGEPALVRTDPELTFSWGGASPAQGVPGREFSVRWTGRLVARSKAIHKFYVQTDGAVRLSVTVDGTERVLIDQPTASGRVAEHVSQPIALDPRQLTEIKLEYRNQGAPAALSLQFGTGPGAKQSVPTPDLYPADGLTSFAPVERSYRRLHKAALILTSFGVSDAQLEWLSGAPPFLNLDALPMEAGAGTDAVAVFRRWRQLAGLYALRKKLPRSNVDLFEVFRAETLPLAIDRLVLATGWDRSVLEAFVGPDGLALDSPIGLRPVPELGVEPMLLRLARAIELQRRVGVAPATLYVWANGIPDADGATAIVQAVKARYDEARWLEVARALNDPLRAERRDALVAYLLPRMRDLGIKNRNQLFEYFLIDVDMNPCMLTSRIRQAIGSVQTFFQRCLMNLESEVSPRIINDNDWKWLKNYRVWEANRKVFLYPENWIEPELRDDKSPLFEVLERTILQQEIKNDNVEAAFADYLEGLDEISRLDVRGVWFEKRQSSHRMVNRPKPKVLRVPLAPPAPRSEWDGGTYHVFARTFNAPYVWYYRRLENGRDWTPWEKIDADIEGDHLVPVIFQRRMHLFWALFREVNKPVPQLDREGKGPPPAVGKDWDIQLAYAVYDRGRWSRKKLSARGVVDVGTFASAWWEKSKLNTYIDGTAALSPRDYTVRTTVMESGEFPQLHLQLYCRAVERVERRKLTLAPSAIELVARFELHGCSGALVPDRERFNRRPVMNVERNSPSLPGLGGKKFAGLRAISAVVKDKTDTQTNTAVRAAMGNVRGSASQPRPVHINAPTGYQVSGMGFAVSSRRGGALLALPGADARGVTVALEGPIDPRHGPHIIPVVDPSKPERRDLYPFFFQDRFRSYFVRPIYADWRPSTAVAVPVLARPVAPARALPPPRRPAPPPRGRRGGRGRREEIEDVQALNFEAQDAWEDEQDEAWHPDDAAEARPPRQRSRPKRASATRPAVRRAPAPTPAGRPPERRFELQRQPGYHEQRLQFTPFEHSDTCRFISTLKARGIEGLLDFSTTRPRQKGRDHVLTPDGKWERRQRSWFQHHYRVGPLVFSGDLPHLDVGFEVDHPYGVYNWELFFHAPLQVAVRLAKDGRHEEAQRWFHFIFDPTTDSSSPTPRRYWRFAPFHENNEYDNAHELLRLLSYDGKEPQLIERQKEVRAQLLAWWEKPFSPHVIARLRIAAYQKAVVMKYIDNLVEWGDKLFRRDTMESIQEATQIYILAANILGPRPEKIPPIVSREPLTFQRMRRGLDLFSNLEVRLENRNVRWPFRNTARPETAGATAVLGIPTQYFCTPPNPQLDKYWDTVADRLSKIRNCMNIQGIVRQLPLFDPPIDPGLLVRAAAAGVDLGSVIADLNAPPPHYRFRFLLGRATRLAEEIRSFGAMTLQVLERRDAEGLASLRASNEALLLDAVRDIRKKQVRQVEEALTEHNLEREHVDMQMQHLNTQLQQLMNPQEEAQQKSMLAAKVISGIAEGVDLVAKVMHAIPEFQTGAAGGFSSPFVTVQLGGQMFGDIASAVASSFEKVMSKHETEGDMAAAQAEFQRRREEWQHELELLGKEKAQVEKRVAETQLKLEITSAELRRHDLEVESSRRVESYLRDKYTSQQLYGWMLGQLSGVYFQAYKVAFDAARQAERAFRFERGDQSSSFIEFSYWDSLKNGLFAGERLLLDLRRMESAHVEGDRRVLEVTRHISLRQDYPLALMELLATGRCQVAVTEALLDGDFPGHYFRRIKTASLTIAGALKPYSNVNCTLTLLENRLRTDANASGSYSQSADADDSRFLVNAAPIQAVATSKPDADPGLFQLRFDDERYLPFEGAGAISTWRIELQQADNAVDLSQIGDVVLTLAYMARTGGAALEAAARADREKGLARGGIKPAAQHLVSLKRDEPAAWKRLEEAPAGQEVEVPLRLDADRLSGRYRGLDVQIERVSAFALARAATGADALRLRLDPPKGSGTPISGFTPPWPKSRILRAGAEVSGAPGVWKLVVNATGAKVSELVDDLVLVFELRARKS